MRNKLLVTIFQVALLCLALIVGTANADINYEIWDGSHDVLPDFSTLGPPAEAGVMNNFDIETLRGDTDNFVFRFTGYIDIDTAGTYTFYTSSDDGSKLYIGDWESVGGEITEVVDNDGLHGTQERSGTIDLGVGIIGIMVTFFEKGGGDVLEVRYEGPGIAKMLIPDEVLKLGYAKSYSPYPGAINVLVEAFLSWEDVQENQEYFVHFGTEPNIPEMTLVVDKEPVNEYDPELGFDTQYYWSVSIEGTDPNGNPILLEGPILGFTTAPKSAVVIGQPTKQEVYPGEDATYSVEVLSAAGAEVSYEWFKEGDSAVLSTESTLVIENVQADDAGMYYCTATNEFGSDTSISAKLFIKLLVSHWPLDEDFEDKIGGRHGVPVGDPLPVIDTEEKIDGAGSAKFSLGGAAAQTVRIPTAGLPTGSSMTISFWEKTPADGPSNGYLLASADADPAGVTGFEYLYMWRRGGSVHYLGLYTTDYTINGDNFNTGNAASGDLGGIAREQWHLCTLVYNYDDPSWQYYVDGEFRYNYGTMARRFEGFIDDLLIANRHNMARAFMGNIDDLRIYNFAMNPVEIAILYTDTVGGYICLNPVAYDLNDDCILDIADLVMLAANWLECNFVPATACP